jgi:hypothetical protein
MPIIHGDMPLTVGQRVTNQRIYYNGYHVQPFLVLREATKAEYMASLSEEDEIDPSKPLGPYYYEISMD